MEDYMKSIGDSIYNFQAALHESGVSLEEFIKNTYCNKWKSEELYHATAIRTTMVNSFTQFLVAEGLLNLEKVMLSIITDPMLSIMGQIRAQPLEQLTIQPVLQNPVIY